MLYYNLKMSKSQSFVIYLKGNTEIPHPFKQTELETEPFSNQTVSGIVIHGKGDTEILDDEHIHIYVEKIGLHVSDVVRYTRKNDSQQTLEVLSVISNSNFDLLDSLTEFLESYSYEADGKEAEEEDFDLEDPYTVFTKNIDEKITGDLQNFVVQILKSMGLSEAIPYVRDHIETFHVATTAQDFNPDPLGNYELLEFLGDRSLWGLITKLFIDYSEKHGIVLDKGRISNLHQQFNSKSRQSSIAKKLKLDTYLKKKGEKTLDTFEDLFESFVGAFVMVNFKIRAGVGLDFRLHERFVNWIYASVDFDTKTTKPAVSRFYEISKSLIGSKIYEDYNFGGFYKLKVSKGYNDETVRRIITENSELYLGKKPSDGFFKKFFETVPQKYGAGEGYLLAREKKYGELNKLIEGEFTNAGINKLATMHNVNKWEEDLRKQYLELSIKLGLEGHILINQTMKKGYESHWVVKDEKDNVAFETLLYDNPDDPQTLISMMNGAIDGQVGTVQGKIKELEYNGIGDFFMKKDRTKVSLIGNFYWLNAYLEENEGTYFSRVTVSDNLEEIINDGFMKEIINSFRGYPEAYIDEKTNLFVKYDVKGKYYYPGKDKKTELSQRPQKERERILDMMGYSLTKVDGEKIPVKKEKFNWYKEHLDPYVHENLGNRGIYEYISIIALFGKEIISEAHLDKIRTFYLSPALKTALTKYLGVIDERTKQLIPFDMLVGMAYHNCEQIANLIYSDLEIDIDAIYKPTNTLKTLRMVLYEEADRQSKRTAKQTIKNSHADYLKIQKSRQRDSSVKIEDTNGLKTLIYSCSNDVKFSIDVTKLMKTESINQFSKFVLYYEQLINTNISIIRNTRFSTNAGYDILKLNMQVRMIEEWFLSYTERKINGSRKIFLTYFTYNNLGNKEVNYVSGPDIININKQLQTRI
jgi:hypothetical protein